MRLRRPRLGSLVAFVLAVVPLLGGIAFGNWFAGFGPALVVVAFVIYRRWTRDPTHL
jgi:hypothetical protein